MNNKPPLTAFNSKLITHNYILQIADNTLILGQRLGELCGHGPSLETDIAMTNIALDLLGQTRSYYQYAAQIIDDENVTEDTIAFLRNEREYRNVLLVEQPNTDFAYTITRQFLFDVFHHLFLTNLQNSEDKTLKAIADKSIKEVSYHIRFSTDWMIRLGDGTDESNQKMQVAIDDLWTFTDELFHETEVDLTMIDAKIGVNLSYLKPIYYQKVAEILTTAKLNTPETKYFQKGGKDGIHSEHMGYILADMQYMQRSFPGMSW